MPAIDREMSLRYSRDVDAQIRQCFENSYALSRLLHRKGIACQYCEGYAGYDGWGIPFEHAWNIIDGKIVDTTWILLDGKPIESAVYLPSITLDWENLKTIDRRAFFFPLTLALHRHNNRYPDLIAKHYWNAELAHALTSRSAIYIAETELELEHGCLDR